MQTSTLNGTSFFVELKPLYANSVWITKNNVKANIWKLYMKFEANKEFMENLSLQEREGDLSLLTFSFSLSQSPCYK